MGTNFTFPSPPGIHCDRDQQELMRLRARLRADGEDDLIAKLAVCGQPLALTCVSCRAQKTVHQRCKRRWCPVCARQLAAARATEIEYIVERMRAPLFLTLTMRHDATVRADDIRRLVRAFGKFRRRRLWTTRIRGGISCVELTAQDGGWHPHMHCVVDCTWMSLTTRPPRRDDPPEVKQATYRRASAEVGTLWARQLGQPTASVRIKRADRCTIAREVVKYTVKNDDLVKCTESAGDIIRALDRTRALRTFGTAHGKTVHGIRQAAREYARTKRREWRESLSETDCCPCCDLVPSALAANVVWDARTQMRRREGGALRALAEARAARAE